MPLYNWQKCLAGAFQYVNHEPKKGPTEVDAKRFQVLEDEYLARYELGHRMERYLKIKIRLTKFRLTYIQTGDKNLLNQIAIEEIELRKADPHKYNAMSVDEVLVQLSKFVNDWIDSKKITVAGFRALIKVYERSNKKE